MKKMLTNQEFEVFKLLLKGYTNGEIASKLVISTNTSKAHVKNIIRKFKAKNRTNVVAFGLFYYLEILEDTQEYLFDFK